MRPGPVPPANRLQILGAIIFATAAFGLLLGSASITFTAIALILAAWALGELLP